MHRKILIAYDSLSGNTATMAEEIGKGAAEAGDIEVLVRKCPEISPAEAREAHAVIAGSPAINRSITGNMLDFLDRCGAELRGKPGAAFGSHGEWEGSYDEVRDLEDHLAKAGVRLECDGMRIMEKPSGQVLLLLRKFGREFAGRIK